MIKKIYKIPFKGYYTRAYSFGDLSKGVPLIILHGGPGVTNRHSVMTGNNDLLDDKEQIIIQGTMLVYSDNVYVFFNENSKDDMEKATGIKSKFFRNIKDGESLYVGIKDGEVNVLIASDEVLFVKEYNPELKYVELSNDGATLFDVRKDNGKTILVY